MFYPNSFNSNLSKTTCFLALIAMLSGTTLKSPFGCCDADPDMLHSAKVAPTRTADEERRQKQAEQEREAREEEERNREDWQLIFWGGCNVFSYHCYGVLFAWCQCGWKKSCRLRENAGKQLSASFDRNVCYDTSSDGKFLTIYRNGIAVSPILTIASQKKAKDELKKELKKISSMGTQSEGQKKLLRDLREESLSLELESEDELVASHIRIFVRPALDRINARKQ